MSLIGCWKANTRDVLILKIVTDISCFATLLLYLYNKIATNEIFQFQKIGSTRKRHGLWQQLGKN
jgi:hypothetical protein